MKAKDIEIPIIGDGLTISSEGKEETGRGKEDRQIERHVGQFARTVTLPGELGETMVEATYQSGVLKVKLPQTDAAMSHEINVAEKK